MMNACDKALIKKEAHPKKERLKANTVPETYSDNSNARISNYIKIIGKEHVHFHPPRGLQKFLIKQNRIETGKVIFNEISVI